MRTTSYLCASILTGALILSSAVSQAAQPNTYNSPSQTVEGQTNLNLGNSQVLVSGRMSLGIANGTADELVYDTEANGRLLSKLSWDIKNVAMLGAGVSVTPLNWLRLNADISAAITEGSGSMDDYDWMVDGWGYTDWSHHDDLTVDSGLMFDMSAEMAILKHTQTVLYAIVGFKHDSWEWSANGGYYIYSTNSLYDTVGNFPAGTEVISYEQTYNTPYIGLGFEALLTPITLNGRIIGSTIVSATDEDHHNLRQMTYTEDFDSGNMIAIDLAATYNFNKHMSLTGSFHYQDFSDLTGSTNATDQKTGVVYYYGGDAAGIDQKLSVAALSFSYKF